MELKSAHRVGLVAALKVETHASLSLPFRSDTVQTLTARLGRRQFFISLDKTDWLDKKHTIFGKITGDTIYNVVDMGKLETDANDRPTVCVLSPHVSTSPRLWERIQGCNVVLPIYIALIGGLGFSAAGETAAKRRHPTGRHPTGRHPTDTSRSNIAVAWLAFHNDLTQRARMQEPIPTIKRVEIIWNPFDDIVPRLAMPSADPDKKRKRKEKKNLVRRLLEWCRVVQPLSLSLSLTPFLTSLAEPVVVRDGGGGGGG